MMSPPVFSHSPPHPTNTHTHTLSVMIGPWLLVRKTELLCWGQVDQGSAGQPVQNPGSSLGSGPACTRYLIWIIAVLCVASWFLQLGDAPGRAEDKHTFFFLTI